VSAFESHIKTLLGENEALREQLSASGARLAAAEGRAAQEAANDGKTLVLVALEPRPAGVLPATSQPSPGRLLRLTLT
jgi:hypothetical protein